MFIIVLMELSVVHTFLVCLEVYRYVMCGSFAILLREFVASEETGLNFCKAFKICLRKLRDRY